MAKAGFEAACVRLLHAGMSEDVLGMASAQSALLSYAHALADAQRDLEAARIANAPAAGAIADTVAELSDLVASRRAAARANRAKRGKGKGIGRRRVKARRKVTEGLGRIGA